MRYVYILLICLILFYILSRYFEKYYSQENFDPSLVPVSSIITLAKVAQKIVDGNGTLTNPANLNIGTTSAKGNLLVTGNSTTNGNKQIDGTLGVTGATTLSNTLDVTGNTTVGGTLGVTGDTTVGGTLGITGATTLTGTLNANGVTTIGATGTPATTNNLTVNGATKINGDTTIKALTISGANVDPIFKFGDNTGHNLSFYSRIYDYTKSPPTLTNDSVDTGTRIYDNGNIVAGRNIKGGNINLTNGFASASSATNAELSSDTGSYKNLMILGNTARGGERNIGMWDNVAISGVLSVGSMSYEGTATTGKVNIGGVTTMKGYGSLAGGCTIPLPAGAYKYPIQINFRWSQGNSASYNSLIHLWTGTGPSGTGAWKAGYSASDCCFPGSTWGSPSSPNCSIPAQAADSTYVYSVEYVGI